VSIESKNQSTYFFRQLRALQSRAEALQQDISDIESLVSQIVTTQENQICEMQSLVNPYSNYGEAICNQRESFGNYD
jgi:TolA-binding protein